MSNKMKLFTKITAAAMAATMMFAVTPSASAQQINSIQELLDKVRSDSATTRAENQQREADFRARRDQQASKLREARAELARLEAQARRVQSTFDTNQGRIDSLSDELKAAQGDFGEVFGLARAKAGEFKATLDASLITSQYPNRTEVLGRVSESKALPSTDELNAIWQAMLGEIRAQRETTTYQAPVANENDGAPQAVTRVGPFAVFTESGSNFLEYTPAAESGDITLALLKSQPGGAISSAASAVNKAGAGDVVFAPIDPTRGGLLKSLERVPTPIERFGNPFLLKTGHGGVIGLIIAWLTIIGVLFGLFRIFVLFTTASAVNGQKRKAQASKGNPLGRVMMAYDRAKGSDAEHVELVLDEAILQESPKLERGLTLLKLGAGIAPLLGLLGTVTGMIKTFQAMMIYGTGDPQLMAGGISEALVTTMMGLVAAIPLLILHSFCSSLARGVQSTLEEQSAGIVARHIENRSS